jgi:hypothetical integral membrane protein (TIGR02206 family)
VGGTADWTRFEPFSALHGAVVLAFVVMVAAAVVRARRAAPEARRETEHSLGVAILALWAAGTVAQVAAPDFDPAWGLPLQLCDLTSLAAGLALVSRRRWARAVVVLWSLALSTQAFVTPIVREGPARLLFWLFWGSHFASVGTAIYELLAAGFRPRWKDWRTAAGAGLGYLALVLPLALALDWSYGFVGDFDARGTVLEWLGPWPWRVAWMALGAAGAMALVVLPFELARVRSAAV